VSQACLADINSCVIAGGFADARSKTNLAWALHAGAAYKASDRLAIELSYPYLNLGRRRPARSRISIRLSSAAIRSRQWPPTTFSLTADASPRSFAVGRPRPPCTWRSAPVSVLRLWDTPPHRGATIWKD